jgi:hypothetical protein
VAQFHAFLDAGVKAQAGGAAGADRLGVTETKKRGNAVVRNRLKRLLREGLAGVEALDRRMLSKLRRIAGPDPVSGASCRAAPRRSYVSTADHAPVARSGR